MFNSSPARAVMYVRMSTENQDYSTDHQRAKIREYAATRNLPIIREYVDDGKSGLDIRRRAGLLALMRDVESTQRDFSHIIVYDISRWGRFQDIDEAAYHEHTCRRAGIEVVYCGEPFTDETGPYASLLKSMKRVMAAEYSRELSEKVFAAQSRFTQMGFKQGGHAGYGLGRLALKACGTPRAILNYGESKIAATDRVVLVWGPTNEVATVRRIYALYLHDQMSVEAIVKILNSEQVLSEFGRPWTQHMIRTLLSNVKYCGILAYNRRSCRLSTQRKHNSRHEWVVNPTALDPIIDSALYEQVQAERARRTHRRTRAELIDLLHVCYTKSGRINSSIITADPAMPDVKMFARQFGSLPRAYEAAGLPSSSAFAAADTRKEVLAKRKELLAEVIHHASIEGAMVERTSEPFALIINGNLTVRVDVLVRRKPPRGQANWALRPNSGIDFIIAELANYSCVRTHNYFLIPSKTLPSKTVYLTETNLAEYAAKGYISLESMFHGAHVTYMEDAC
ncbi:recombinase family protein [Massilia sp. BKSP1R2A-1]|uniref:recombinase family protein n=1 Tax=Massilia sp. BKSP1R2A-1 TaxID=3422595 RepID=UPI003D3563FF